MWNFREALTRLNQEIMSNDTHQRNAIGMLGNQLEEVTSTQNYDHLQLSELIRDHITLKQVMESFNSSLLLDKSATDAFMSEVDQKINSLQVSTNQIQYQISMLKEVNNKIHQIQDSISQLNHTVGGKSKE